MCRYGRWVNFKDEDQEDTSADVEGDAMADN
jgi:hypothetical protein